MADEVIIRDENNAVVGAGVSDDANQEIMMLRVDPVTKYLLINVEEGSPTAATASQIASRDQNNRTVCMGWDETNGVLQEILTDADGNLLVQFD